MESIWQIDGTKIIYAKGAQITCKKETAIFALQLMLNAIQTGNTSYNSLCDAFNQKYKLMLLQHALCLLDAEIRQKLGPHALKNLGNMWQNITDKPEILSPYYQHDFDGYAIGPWAISTDKKDLFFRAASISRTTPRILFQANILMQHIKAFPNPIALNDESKKAIDTFNTIAKHSNIAAIPPIKTFSSNGQNYSVLNVPWPEHTQRAFKTYRDIKSSGGITIQTQRIGAQEYTRIWVMDIPIPTSREYDIEVLEALLDFKQPSTTKEICDYINGDTSEKNIAMTRVSLKRIEKWGQTLCAEEKYEPGLLVRQIMGQNKTVHINPAILTAPPATPLFF